LIAALRIGWGWWWWWRLGCCCRGCGDARGLDTGIRFWLWVATWASGFASASVGVGAAAGD